MPFIKELPEWNKQGVKPPQSRLDSGWGESDKPPADWFNWLHYSTNEALKELQQNAAHKDEIAIQDASTTQKGVVQLNDTTTSTSTTLAATANSVKKVNDSVNEHLADEVRHITAEERTKWNNAGITDTISGKTYKWSMENGGLFLEEVL